MVAGALLWHVTAQAAPTPISGIGTTNRIASPDYFPFNAVAPSLKTKTITWGQALSNATLSGGTTINTAFVQYAWVTNLFNGAGNSIGGAFGADGVVQSARNGTNWGSTNFVHNVAEDGVSIWNQPLGLLGSAQLNVGTGGIINSGGGYRHTLGAENGIVFISDGSGNAAWGSNVTHLNVTNLSIINNFNFKGNTITHINLDWTNDTVVLKTTSAVPIRGGGNSTSGNGPTLGIPIADYLRTTNVGPGSFSLGSNNLVRGDWSSVLGGVYNEIDTNAQRNVIAGGGTNVIRAGAFFNVIGGGTRNDIGASTVFGFIGGGFDHTIAASLNYPTIAGGSQNTVEGNYGTIGGGAGNRIRSSAESSFIGGGLNNDIFEWDGSPADGAKASVIGGGSANSVRGQYGTIGGGSDNVVFAGSYAVIAGGQGNEIGVSLQSAASHAFIGGGFDHVIQNAADYSVLGGGYQNTVTAGSTNAVVVGGRENTVSANTIYASILGGIRNTTSGDYSVLSGSSNSVTADYAHAYGHKLTNSTAGSIDFGTDNATKMTLASDGTLTVRGPFSTSGDTTMTGKTVVNGGLKLRRKFTGTNYTTVAADVLIHCTNTTPITITLLAAATVGDGAVLVIKDAGGNAATQNITIDGNASETIDGTTTKTINSAYQSYSLYCDGANWFIW